MDGRVDLVLRYYAGMPADRAKIETSRHGFAFVDELLSGGGALEYGELTLTGLLHKYKLSGLPEGRLRGLVAAHVSSEWNVCLYFGGTVSRHFCFNLDNNHKVNNHVVIPEMEAAVSFLCRHLSDLGCAPLPIASGRGFHLWCRLAEAERNERLYMLMLRSAAMTAAELSRRGMDHTRVKMNLYPDRRTHDTVSLRLFGSRHAATGLFSAVVGPSGPMDEAASWTRFEEHMDGSTIGRDVFAGAHDAMAAAF